MVTVCDAAGTRPSAGVYDQFHVPEAFVPAGVTVPTEALSVTVSPALASDQVPLFAAGEPSLTVTVAFVAAIAGALFDATKWPKMSARFPLVPPVLFEMHGVGEPDVVVPVSTILPPTLVPFVHRSKVLPLVGVETDVNRTDSPLPPNPGMFVVLPEVTVSVRPVVVAVPEHVVLESHVL